MSTGTSTGTAKLKRRTSSNCLPTKWVVQGRRQRQEAVLPRQEPRAFDKSHAGRSLRYVSFVLGLGATVSAALFTPPLLFMARFGACERGCQSLAKDLSRSISHKVHPCDDFYEHVCSGWDSTKVQSPLSNYQAAFSRRIVKDMMLKKIPSRSTTAWGKAAGFIYRCLSRVEIHDLSSVTSFLHELGLPWPEKSPTNRQQLLDIFVKASLEFGMPMFVAFYVGRHPARPFVNTIYVTLEGRFSDWTADMEALAERGKADDYLRRCAETVGREGQSYSSMIRQVLQTHFEVVDLERLLWDDAAVPRFYNLSDPDLRRAVNGHLPDESQLWPEDEIVVLQPEFIVKLDEEQLSHSGYQESFKLFLGAYVVWALSPLVSRRLGTRLLVDIGGRSSEAAHRLSKCMQALEMLMPLVKEQLHRDAQKDLWPTWTVARLSARSMVSFFDTYGGLPKAFAYAVLSRLCVNAFNMTNTWHLLDNALAYFPNNTDEPFFDLYRRAAKATVTFFKQSLRRPQHNIHHVPGIVDFDVYRLLVNREVSVFHYLTSSPLYEPWYPAAVISALAGTAVSTQMTALLRMAIYYDRNFQHIRFEDGTPETMRLALDVYRFRNVLKVSGIFHDASKQDHGALYRASIAAHAASRVPEMPEWRRFAADGVHNPSMDEDVRNPFRRFQPEQLFFYLACFAHCGKRGRQRQKSVAICNVALPASPRFRRAFNCLPQNLLITNFTWPDPPMAFDDDPFQ
ncbi:hypothetical protein HPB50_011788 [Hyalomma asiaticum]|uniref:Uncharacterized protein n=1 Tax=Hyalomma asiaticum TaxID=266040 RepID=A0ACB7SBT5_HYAAI|nr:hypothetical protein HPB50_011788 [Hyalomma asiaticum]